jgi:O-methyltransferase domain
LGIYSVIFAQHQANFRAIVCELPPIVPSALEIIARHDMQAQVSIHPGNYCQDDLGQEYQLVLLSNNLQTEGLETCQTILCKVFAALAPDGQLLIHGVMPHADRVSPPPPALFQVQRLVSFP